MKDYPLWITSSDVNEQVPVVASKNLTPDLCVDTTTCPSGEKKTIIIDVPLIPFSMNRCSFVLMSTWPPDLHAVIFLTK
jgi:hypothetical protein